MIDALESLNLTQISQSNAKEMIWDERECFGLAQYAHKYVKCPRMRAKSRPPSIYSPTNKYSRYAITGLKIMSGRRADAKQRTRHPSVYRSDGRHVSCAFEFQWSIP
jgi:hypothetical protein